MGNTMEENMESEPEEGSEYSEAESMNTMLENTESESEDGSEYSDTENANTTEEHTKPKNMESEEYELVERPEMPKISSLNDVQNKMIRERRYKQLKGQKNKQ